MRFVATLALATISATVTIGAARADINYAPPPGAILDLNGQPVPSATYQLYSTTFTAQSTSTYVTFAFRNDPGFFGFDDASVTAAGSSLNLLSNPGFDTPPNDGTEQPWKDYGQVGVTYTGVILPSQGASGLTPRSGHYFWYDGSTGGYDFLYQQIATELDQTYTVQFYLSQATTQGGVPPITTFSDICTNGQTGTSCNGADALVYAGDSLPSTVPPTGTPEPETSGLLAAGIAGLAVFARRRRA
jgi:hypothetical protein